MIKDICKISATNIRLTSEWNVGSISSGSEIKWGCLLLAYPFYFVPDIKCQSSKARKINILKIKNKNTRIGQNNIIHIYSD